MHMSTIYHSMMQLTAAATIIVFVYRKTSLPAMIRSSKRQQDLHTIMSIFFLPEGRLFNNHDTATG